MSTVLAQKLYDYIGKIRHLRSYEFLKAIETKTESDGYARITYAQWRDDHGMHAFILNQCTRECGQLGFIELARQSRNGDMSNKGGKGTRKIYRLTLNDVGKEKAVSETNNQKKRNPAKRKNAKKVTR